MGMMKVNRAVLAALFLLSSSFCGFAQDLYVMESRRINIYSSTGDFLSFIPFTGPEASGPEGLAFDSAGSLYISSSDSVSGTITKITLQGQQSIFASGHVLEEVASIAFDNLGNLYAAGHSFLGPIIKIAPDGTPSGFAQVVENETNNYRSLVFSAFDGDLYAVEDNSIYQFTLQGTRTLVTNIGSTIFGIAIDPLGIIYAASGDNNIYRVTPQGIVTPFALNAHSTGLAFDTAGNLYSLDPFDGTVEKFDSLGVATTFVSGLDNPRFIIFGPAAVPEPPTELLLVVGVVTVLAGRRFLRARTTAS
jgi:DNA-binding beta-propeller fold protein YncE